MKTMNKYQVTVNLIKNSENEFVYVIKKEGTALETKFWSMPFETKIDFLSRISDDITKIIVEYTLFN